MKAVFKIPSLLHQAMMQDLIRSHPFAHERIGFALGRASRLSADTALVLLTRYHPIPDEHYIADPKVGARIGTEALSWAMQAAYHGRAASEGIFHVHLHGHAGETGMSQTDYSEIPKMIPGFQTVGRTAPHGILILSLDHGSGWVWLPKSPPVQAESVSVIGAPIGVYARGARS